MALRYVVKLGDTAARIAARFTGNAGRWGEMRALNPRASRSWNVLIPGEVLWLPSSWSAPAGRIGGIGQVSTITLEKARAETYWLPDEVFERFDALCTNLSIPTLWGAAVVFYESGWKPWSQNPGTRATGLMQWMPRFSPVPVDSLVRMSALQQLPYLAQWWREKAAARGGRPFTSPGLVYALVAAPGKLTPTADERTVAYERPAPGKPGHERPVGDAIYEWNYWANESWDTNGDGRIDMGDFTRIVQRQMALATFAPIRVRVEALGGPPAPPIPPASPSTSGSSSSGGLVARGALADFARAVAVTVAVGGAATIAARLLVPEMFDRTPRGAPAHG